MDTRIVFAVIAVFLVYWLVRSRMTPHLPSSDNSDSTERRNRRFSDRTYSGRQLQNACERQGQQEIGQDVSTASGSTEAATASLATLVPIAHTGTQFSASASEECADRTPIAATHSGTSDMQAEIERLTEQVQKRDRKLMRNRHAMEEVEKLNKKLFERGRELEMLKQACARSDAALAHYRTRAQQGAMFEQQLTEVRKQSAAQQTQIKDLHKQLAAQCESSDARETQSSTHRPAEAVTRQAERKNQLNKQQLSSELREVEADARLAQQNVLELRRIRGELDSVRADRANAQNRISELQVRVREQQAALEEARLSAEPSSKEISVLKRSLVDRQLQNEVLRQQLARLSSDDATGLPAGGTPDNR